jgi:hypothetical protein
MSLLDKIKHLDVLIGRKLRVTSITTTAGYMIKGENLAYRQLNDIGEYVGYVPGHGGDVIWFKSDISGHTCAYGLEELDYYITSRFKVTVKETVVVERLVEYEIGLEGITNTLTKERAAEMVEASTNDILQECLIKETPDWSSRVLNEIEVERTER